MVCTGNICRSPTAEVALQIALEKTAGAAKNICIESAGISASHIGEPADPRSQHHAAQRGLDLSYHRARGVIHEDFQKFDLILSMDYSHQKWLEDMCPDPHYLTRIAPYLSFYPDQQELISLGHGHNMPDPYWAGDAGFAHVLDLIERTTPEIIDILMYA